jgi:simple sugar transport system ATP-binding protein
LSATVAENLIIASRKSYVNHGVMGKKRIEERTRTLLDTYSVKGRSHMPMGTLSGGNIQKVILAREMEQYRDHIVFSEPTWGLDIASSLFVYEKMLELRDNGAAVILISSNLDEILALSDRIIIFYRGTVVALLEAKELKQVTKEEMGAYMLGLKRQEGPNG